ncbi:MAG: FkbM family methyltransferase, partial [Pseudomonadota bacterium]|nr:FkbM family methyltransferase [Pseudomonadota bacterium]
MIPDYEQMLEEFYTQLLEPGDTCIDVGAHVGRHTLPMARRIGTGGKVFAFEPISFVAAKLQAELDADADLAATVHLSQCALADTEGEIDFI